MASFRADAKCKMTIGETGYPIAPVTTGKEVTVATNEKFMVGDHDLSRLSFIPEAYLLHDIPDAWSVDEVRKVLRFLLVCLYTVTVVWK